MTKSTGPKSQAGKNISSLNAFKHGLSSRHWLNEKQAVYYEMILISLTHEYQPQTPTEVLMIERVAVTMTKAKRLTDIEDAQYQLAKELVAQKLKGPISAHRDDILRPIQGNAERNGEILNLQQDASLPSIEVMNLINRQQNALSRQLSKELSELITVINLRNSRQTNLKQPSQLDAPEGADCDLE
jgi:hypothetical protein